MRCRPLIELLELATQHAERNITHPREILAGHFYSNGKLGKLWSVRQVVESSAASAAPAHDTATVTYKVLAGDGMNRLGECSVGEFRQWARFEVQPQGNGRWFKVE